MNCNLKISEPQQLDERGLPVFTSLPRCNRGTYCIFTGSEDLCPHNPHNILESFGIGKKKEEEEEEATPDLVVAPPKQTKSQPKPELNEYERWLSGSAVKGDL